MAACTLYNLCFFVYIWLMPVFLKFLIRAPSNFDPAPFYPVPMRTLSGDVPPLYMSSFPQTTRPGVNHCRPCQELGGQRSGMYQWDIMLSISERDLIKESKDKPVSTMYPLVFASNDARTWKVVADADDVAGKGHWAGKNNDADEATHLSAPLLVANLKNFGCIDDETVETDPFFHHFSSASKARQYKWHLVKHVAMHGSVNLVACIMQGMDELNQLIHTYARDCIYQGEMKCHLTARQALGKCFALGSACGQACGFFSPNSPVCKEGTVNPKLFEGLTHRRVKIKTSPGGGGAAEALVYCSKTPCDSGLHFNNMYVEAENPIEFLKAQMDTKNKEKGSYYTLMFAMSDYHPPMHTFEVVDDESDDDDKDEEAAHHHTHHLHHGSHEEAHHQDHEHSEHKKGDEDKKGDDDEKPKTTPKPKPKKKHKRTCVDLPGVRLGEIEHSGLAHFVDEEPTNSPLGCTSWCGQHSACQQSIFAHVNKGCYTFKIKTVEARNYSALFNSSYCGDAADKEDMMIMLHQAYKNYVPPALPSPVGAPLRRLAGEEDATLRALQAGMLPQVAQGPPQAAEEDIDANRKFYWQIAQVPNGTRGVLTDQGANSVRVIPRNTSCFTTPGFIYMVACMTGKPVYVPDRTHPIRPPPFNDRCLALGGLCGATCGSGQKVNDNVAKDCPLGMGEVGMGGAPMRRLQGRSPYASAHIPKAMLVQPLEDQTNSSQQCQSARVFYNLFIIISTVCFITTVLNKFPGNFRDRHPIHTWDEIRTHGYVLDKFGSAVTVSTSAIEDKTVIFRSWVGKITTRPESNDATVPTFAKWVDVFCDEGHREGARILWMAWTEFLDTSPPMEFLQEWALAMRDFSPELAATLSPFDLKWSHLKNKKVLPVVPNQAAAFGDDAPQGGVTLQPDCLAKLRDLAAVFKSLPADLSAEASLPRADDMVLTRRVLLDLQGGNKAANVYSISYSSNWQQDLERKAEQRWKDLQLPSRDRYEKQLTATDKNGKKINVFSSDAKKLKEEQFPLHFREPPVRKDRQVIMIYCARGRPETDRKGIEKTRGLDTYLWASLKPSAVRKVGKDGSNKRVYNPKKPKNEEERPLLNDEASERSWSSLQSGDAGIFEEVKRCVEGAVERQHRNFLDDDGEESPEAANDRPLSGAELQRELTKAYLKHRTVDSDWEMARFCHGEVMGVERDADGDEFVVLDNPSPAFLELVGDPPAIGGDKSAIGLVSFDPDSKDRTVRAVKPSLTFAFVNTKPDSPDSGNFQKEFSRKLQQAVADPTLDINSLKVQEQKKGNKLIVDVTGPSKVIEGVRRSNVRILEVFNYTGSTINTHPCIAVKKELLMPYHGVRGRSGGLNFVVDLLQFREGFIGTGQDGDITPDRMLMGVFDSIQQPHLDFWKRCFPKFMIHIDLYSYKVNDDVALVQAPVSAGQNDSDALMGVSLSILNMIRGRSGGVTGCGTNEVWQISAKRFSRVEDEAAEREFFQTRTLLHGTATTHTSFCNGQRSVYVPEKVATGILKPNSECLKEMQMNAEGSVQLFWVELLINRSMSLLKGVLAILALVLLLWLLLVGPTSKDVIGWALFCDADNPSLLLGSANPVCTMASDLLGKVLGRNQDKTRLEAAQPHYMELIDMALCWLVVCLVMMAVSVFLAFKNVMPSISRILIMLENVTYWMTSWNIFYWLALVLFMVIGMDPPLMFEGGEFMAFVLILNLTHACMLSEWKAMTDCTELSVWRSQQSHTLAAPLYLHAVVQGTINAWHIVTGKRDCSFWRSSTTAEVVTHVTVWVTFIWVAFLCCVCAILVVNLRQLVSGQTAAKLQGEEHFSAAFLIGLIAITVQEPFLSLWAMDKKMEAITKSEKSGKLKARLCANLVLMFRSKAWILRYIIDFVIPILVICGVLRGSHMLITLVAYGSTVHGLRI